MASAPSCFIHIGILSLAAAAIGSAQAQPITPIESHGVRSPIDLRIATFNIEDVRTSDIADPSNPRLRRLGAVIRELKPNIILLNEIAYDGPGSPGYQEIDAPGLNGQRFADTFIHLPEGSTEDSGGSGIRYRAFMAPVNTGMHSGFDLDNDGRVVSTYPTPTPSRPDGSPPKQTAEERAYGNDCWGFGAFPGQYGMTLLVDERLEILQADVRTFRLMPWDYVSGAFEPRVPETNEPWHNKEEWAIFRLSSKSHWDVPVRLPNGETIHVLCSHPTPPAFDGPEMRNQKRNHDEIRFWADYLDNAPYIVDDLNHPGGLRPDAHFVIVGDLNADPEKGSSYKNPIKRNLFANPRVNGSNTPTSDLPVAELAPTDTAMFKLRVDYVLPSHTLEPLRTAVWRSNPAPADHPFPSDHFPVWMDIRVVPR